LKIKLEEACSLLKSPASLLRRPGDVLDAAPLHEGSLVEGHQIVNFWRDLIFNWEAELLSLFVGDWMVMSGCPCPIT